MTSGGEGVKRADISTVGELYRQFEARYEAVQRSSEDIESRYWKKRKVIELTTVGSPRLSPVSRFGFQAYSYTDKLSDGKWHTVQVVRTDRGAYHLKLYTQGEKETFDVFERGAKETYRFILLGDTRQPCLLKEAADNALEAMSLSVEILFASYSPGYNENYPPHIYSSGDSCENLKGRTNPPRGSWLVIE